MTVTAATSVAAFRSAAPLIGSIKEQILDVLEIAGPTGAIGDEVRDVLLSRGMKDGSLNTRYSELEREGLMFRNGETRPAKTGRDQLVMRAARYATTVPLIVGAAKRRRPAFLAGLMHATKLVAAAGSLEAAKSALREELVRTARRSGPGAKRAT